METVEVPLVDVMTVDVLRVLVPVKQITPPVRTFTPERPLIVVRSIK
jgi:hypothetical protein